MKLLQIPLSFSDTSIPYPLGSQPPTNGGSEPNTGGTTSLLDVVGTKKEGVFRRFRGTVELDATRLGRDAGRISDEVLTHLTSLVGAKAKIVLEIDVEVPDGIPEDKVRVINENCNTLKFKGFEFEEG
ncbi:hypothetical protein ATHL_00895 [Anaerolinea thermolimosa]|uniref:hypothetical protein n=1 Tax=Anaerolinea thermolimosa TaxID=229919 RepID=UPI00078053ED|nr:hypothetical protein [Anaerolinea thermolimosa]GAP06049.1 hypothetical protein ATHL_00895 [Anaerolinea thermolimosa]